MQAPSARAVTRPWLSWWVLAFAVLATAPAWPGLDSHYLGIAVRACLVIAVGQSWNVVAGIGGQMSLGHGVFFGTGAYLVALLFNAAGLSPWFGAVAAVAATVLLAAIVGGISLRLRGVYFALATVAVSLGFEELARHFVGLTGGDSGLAVRFVGTSWPAAQSVSPVPFFWASLALVAAYAALTRAVLLSRFGSSLRAVRDDETAAAVSGVDVLRTKMAGLLLSAGMTGLAGALYVQFYLAIDPDTAFGLIQAVRIQLPALIGGLGTVGGPILGGAIMVVVGEAANVAGTDLHVPGLDILIYALILLAVVIWRPLGLLGSRRRRA